MKDNKVERARQAAAMLRRQFLQGDAGQKRQKATKGQKGPGLNGTYLIYKEAFSVSITKIKDSETPALALENACFERLRPVPNWRFPLSKCHSGQA